MSLTQSTTIRRRLSLMAGSSLVAASFTASLSLTAMLAPTAALAANECVVIGVDPTANDPGLVTRNPDSYVCSANDYPNGITYTSHGNLTVTTNTSTTVMTTNAGGIDLDGLLGDNVTFTATRPISGTAGPVIEVTSQSGAISVSTTAAITANTLTASHAIRAVSSGGGAVTVTTGAGTINANANIVTTGESAIEARSTGGNGAVTVTTGSGSITGRVRGIHAQSSGTGALTITTNGSVSLNSTSTNGGVGQIAAIDATSGTGLLSITVGGNGTITGVAGSAIRASAGNDIELDIGVGRIVTAGLADISGTSVDSTPSLWVVDLTAADAVTIDNDGLIRSNVGTSGQSRGVDDRTLRVAGQSLLLDNSGRIQGRVDFSQVAQGAVFNVTGASNGGTSAAGWYSAGLSTFSNTGSDTLSIAASALVSTGHRLIAPGTPLVGGNFAAIEGPTTFDFGGGASDTVNNAGTLVVGVAAESISAAGQLTITGLEFFNNSGLISLDDRSANEVVTIHDTTFNGLTGSRVTIDASLDRPQAGCADIAAAVALGQLGVADCLDLSGSTTLGSTLLTLVDVTPTNRFGGYLGDGIVLVEINDGVSAAGHFTIDPTSDNYLASASAGGMLKKGYFLYELVYADGAHRLVSSPDAELMEFTAAGQAVQGIWRTSTAMALDRSAHLRATEEGAGVWLRVNVEEAERELIQSFTSAGTTFDFDNSYQQRTNSLTGGIDLAGEAFGGQYLIGAMLGFVRSELGFDTSTTNFLYEGGTLGLYSHYTMGGFFVDAAVNGLVLASDLEAPAVGLPTGLTKHESVRAVGAKAEAGWRLNMGSFYAEPFVSAAYARSRLDQIVLTEAKLDYDDPTSMQVGAGLRVGANVGLARLDLTGRVLNELEGDTTVVIDNDGFDLPLSDDFGGAYSELSGGLSVEGGPGLVLSFRGRVVFHDTYDATNLSAGLSYRW